ncbi:hypothetical protein Tco_1248207, partial [Tanacetum coccineum]
MRVPSTKFTRVCLVLVLWRLVEEVRVGLVDAVVAYLTQFAAEIVAGTLLICDVAATCVGSTRGATQ